MIKISIKTVKPGTLPWNRVGDWTWKGERLEISVNDCSDERFEWLLAIHEITEAFLCKVRGISEASIDQFDIEHEGKWVPSGPGYPEHLIATGIEQILAGSSGVIWDKYENELAEEGFKEVVHRENEKTIV